MKKRLFSYSVIYLLLSVILALYLNVNILHYFQFPIWGVKLILCFILALITLGLGWFWYSKLFAKLFNIDFIKAIKMDIFTYLPLLLLIFSFINIEDYTKGWITGQILLLVILFFITVLKKAVILNIKEQFTYSYLLIAFVTILPVFAINYFFIAHFIGHDSEVEENIEEELESAYNADPLSLFKNELAGVYKKKIRIADETRNSLILMPPKRIEAKMNVPPKSMLQFGFGICEVSYTGEGDGILFNVFIKDEGGIKRVYKNYIDAKHYERDRQWFDVNIDLKDYHNKEIILIFEALGSSPDIQSLFEIGTDNRDDYLAISDPMIIPFKPRKDITSYNVILISLDTLRADHLGCYGYKRKNISSYIDKLANNGILFVNAISQSPWTTPSHMSIFTSLLPSYHRVNEPIIKMINSENGHGYFRVLSEDITTLTEVFKSNGYTTTAFTGGTTMEGKFGLCQGFDSYSAKSRKSFAGDSGFNELNNWLEDNKDQAFFLFLHTFRVHTPHTDLNYASEVMSETEIEELKEYFKGIPVKKTLVGDHLDNKLKEMNLFKKEVIKVLYDGGITETDKYIGKLVESLKRLNLIDKTIIVLTSDHGEEFGEHNQNKFYCEHGYTLYDEALRVPLIFVVPGDFPKGERIKSQVRLIDIMPTLFDLTQIRYEKNKVQGVSLVPFLKGKATDNNGMEAISEAIITQDYEKKSIRTNGFKYIYTVLGKKGDRIIVSDDPDEQELYDLKNDHGEKNNLYSSKTKLSYTLKKKINNTLKGALKVLNDVKKEKRIKIGQEEKNKFKALGYLQ
jgi:arylsulfatase A-like enzyme